MFRPNCNPLTGICGILHQNNKRKIYAKLTVVICCQIVDYKYTAPSSSRFRRRWLLPKACGLSLRQLEKQSPSYYSDLLMYSSIKKNKIDFFLIFDSNYFQANQTAILL